MFQVKTELLDTHEALLEVEIDQSTFATAMTKAARSISEQVNIPGFRKGKAPYATVVRYVGEPAVQREAAEELLEEHYPAFIDEAKIDPYAQGQLETIDYAPLRYRIRVPLMPSVTLGDYEQLRRDWVDPAVTEAEINGVLDQMRQQHAKLVPVERPAQLGDEVHIDVVGVAGDETIVDEKDIPVQMSEEAPFLSLEFVQSLAGATVGEERTFAIPLPDTISEVSLRGLETTFTVKIEHIFERSLPALDDALASTVGAYETLDALVASVRQRLQQSKIQQQQEAYQTALVNSLVEQSQVAYPPAALEHTVEDMMKDLEEQTQRTRKMSLEDSLRLEGRTLEDLHEELHPRAETRLKRSLVLSQFAELEKIEVSDDEVAEEYTQAMEAVGLASHMPEKLPRLDSRLALDLRSAVFGRKALARLAAYGRGEAQRAVSDASPSPAETEPSEA